MRNLKLFLFVTVSSALVAATCRAEQVTIPSQTLIYVETDQPISGKKKHTQEGQVVRSTVWRDVEVDGRNVIRAGTPVLVRVDSLKGAKIAGIKGKMSLGAYDTTAVDGTTLELGGGYLKEGSGRIALTATLAALVFLPLIFIKGKSAEIPRGTVFDATTKRATTIDLNATPVGPKINLNGAAGPKLDDEVLYDELSKTDKPEVFAFSIRAPASASKNFVIDNVNGVKVEPLELKVQSLSVSDGKEDFRGEIEIKKLGKTFKKGINTFEIATDVDGERVAKEVILDIQF